MSLTFELKVATVWTDVTTYVMKSKGELRTGNIVDEITVVFNPTIEDDVVTLASSMEIRMKNGSVVVFSGTLWNIVPTGGVYITCVCQSYTGQFLNAIVNEIYNDATPEAILADLIGSYTDLTDATSEVSGFTITGTLQYINTKLIDCINELCSILMWQVRVDSAKNIYFEPRGYQETGLTLTVGTDIYGLPNWERSTDTTINAIVFDGDNQEFDTIETFNGDGAEDTFTLTFVPNIVQVYIDTTLQTPQVTGSTVTGDYTVDKQNKEIIFASAPAVGTDNVIINYSYQVPIHIETQASSTLTQDAIRLKTFVNKSITTYADARKFIQMIFTRFAVPQINCTNIKIKWNSLIVNNSKVTFIDDYITPAINNSLVVCRIKFEYPSPLVTLVIGEEPFLYYNYQAEITKKLNELTSRNTSTSIIQRYLALPHNFNIDISKTRSLYTKLLNDTPICDDAGTHVNSIVYDSTNAMMLEDFETEGDWSATGGAVAADSTAAHFWIGTQGTKLTPDTAESTITNTSTSNDLHLVTGENSGTPSSGTAGLWCYAADGSNITSLKLRLGSDSSNYNEYTADYYYTLTEPVDELLTLALFDLDDPTTEVGTVDWTGIDWLQILTTTASNEPVTFDYLTVSESNDISFCGAGARQTLFTTIV